jgi:predicted membrane protein
MTCGGRADGAARPEQCDVWLSSKDYFFFLAVFFLAVFFAAFFTVFFAFFAFFAMVSSEGGLNEMRKPRISMHVVKSTQHFENWYAAPP